MTELSLLKLLKELEWSGSVKEDYGHFDYTWVEKCPICHARKDSLRDLTHEKGCRLRLEISYLEHLTDNVPEPPEPVNFSELLPGEMFFLSANDRTKYRKIPVHWYSKPGVTVNAERFGGYDFRFYLQDDTPVFRTIEGWR